MEDMTRPDNIREDALVRKGNKCREEITTAKEEITTAKKIPWTANFQGFISQSLISFLTRPHSGYFTV